jgi:FKBP-type peptidyl-prolyl cis-trans isomerase
MLFDNIFSFASEGAKSCEGIGQSLSNEIPGASPSAKIVREESPEALAVLGFISTLTKATQQATNKQNADANDPGSTSKAASSVVEKASESLQFADLTKATQQAAKPTEP